MRWRTPLGTTKPSPRGNIDNAIFEIDQEMSIENEKEFIDVLVFVPVIFALNRPPASTTESFTLAKRLVVPFIGAGIWPVSARRSVQAVRAEC